MTTIAGTQQTVFDPGIGWVGDQYGLQQTWTAGQGLTAASDLGIGTFCWGINGTKKATQAKGSNTQLAGFVMRSQANPFPVGSINLGYSMVVPAQYSAAINRNGNFIASIFVSYNAGSVVNVGDAVYIDNVTGTLAVGVTVQPGYTLSDFKVIIVGVTDNSGTNAVVISNQNDFLGK